MRLRTFVVRLINNHTFCTTQSPRWPSVHVCSRRDLCSPISVRIVSKTGIMTPQHKKFLRISDFDAYGFDLDHTLAKYKLVELFKLAYESITTFLVDQKGYDISLKNDLMKYKNFVCKGLFLDIAKGNILKLADDGHILQATHGTRPMTRAELEETYGKACIWKETEGVKENMKSTTDQYRFFENYYDTPGLVAMARIIDMLDEESKGPQKPETYQQVWRDIYESLGDSYQYHSFAKDAGGFFPAFKRHSDRFLEQCSQDIRRWLLSLRQENKVVFLLTSSFSDFAGLTLETVLGKDWEKYFDVSLFYARKPSFFSGSNPCFRIENHEEKEKVERLEAGCWYSQGSLPLLQEFIQQQTGKQNPRVLYFGDNICADCYPSKVHADWETVLVLEEMDAEGYTCSDGTVPEHELPSKKQKFEHSSLVTEEEMDWLISDFWGNFLIHPREENGKTNEKTMNTFWGSVISIYADVAVPSVEYLAAVPLDHQFEVFTMESGNTRGFHPGKPASLLP